ncbi:MAG: NAD-dependent epimerase/dehydratase family protein [Candidatus Kapabacteria bacterium]|nr:NAD-dependent epimerase/dehydratase family protein [Candidatus Kapabacteria bacterium]MCS7168992.1 NAD-dependent epimerase/dehydratase family protein [Candidatus Kapabacteria bacterium]MDW7997210.1 NAD-dependent epimerase/dehydratase family protein [Bacteroidota bacterium]MDW8224773.1 NAD-dependent epimerase/dehydratase family protein [Bacteroidota bacterium]
MNNIVSLVTGAGGEIGHSLIEALAERGIPILATDLRPLPPPIARRCYRVIVGDITEPELHGQLLQIGFRRVFHLAAVLSSQAEREPEAAHRVNVEGTLRLLQTTHRMAKRHGEPISFLFPSSIAVYGIPSLDEKRRAGRVREEQYLTPMTIYGANKLYCELLGLYYARFYRRLAPEPEAGWIDFRALRFPGLLSAFTVPTGGTSDYAPEMLHAAAQGKPYHCFVRPDTRIPFMAMPDAVHAMLLLAEAPTSALRSHVYNVTAFSASAEEIATEARRLFPQAHITFEPDPRRQAIVDTWPEALDDSAAQRDWGWAATHDWERTFSEYLASNIRRRYQRAIT